MVCDAELTTNTLTSPSLPVLTCKTRKRTASSETWSVRFWRQRGSSDLPAVHSKALVLSSAARKQSRVWTMGKWGPVPDAGGKARSTLQHEIRQHGHTNNGVQGEGWQVCHRGVPSIPGGDGACQHPCVRMLMRQHGPPVWGGLGTLLSLARSHRAAPAEALSTPPLPPPLGMCHRLLSKGELARALPATDKWLLWTLVI